MIIVTGGAGFIGANLIKQLNLNGRDDILVVDDLKDGSKFVNIVEYDVADYCDQSLFISAVEENLHNKQSDAALSNIRIDKVDAIFHLGACSATTEWDGEYLMENNYRYSKVLLHFCMHHQIPFIYASSAATYGNNTTFVEERQYERPVNVYGYSKFLFDQYVRKQLPKSKSQIVGLKYFNVYGPHEQHKGSMASVAFHHYQQFKKNQTVKLFGEYGGYSAGQQQRDFVYVEDVVRVNLWFFANASVSGIFNCGTGQAEPFNNIANTIVDYFGSKKVGKIDYIDFPEHLKGHYQCFTEASLTNLRQVGCDVKFQSVKEGVTKYVQWLEKNQ